MRKELFKKIKLEKINKGIIIETNGNYEIVHQSERKK